MSADFSLGGDQFDQADWSALCTDLFQSGGMELLGGFEDDEHYGHGDIPPFAGETMSLTASGGTRGVWLERADDGGYDIRMAALSSRADWRFLNTILLLATKSGGVASYDDEGLVLDGSEHFSEEASDARWARYWAAGYGSFRSIIQDPESGGAQIQTPAGVMRLTSEHMQMPSEPFHDWLVSKVETYTTAFQATMMKIGLPSGGEAIMSVYSDIDTMISKDAGYVSLGPITPDSWVPIADFTKIIGNCEELEHAYFVPCVDFEQNPGLLQSLQAALVDIESIQGTPAASDNELTEDDAALLSQAPVLVFLLVAAADGNIDKKEVRAFQKCCELALEKPDGSLLRSAISVAATHLEDMIAVCMQSDPGEQLAAIRELVDSKIDPDSAFAFKGGLLMLGHQIASASGGGLLGKLGLSRSKIDESEHMALASLIMLLDLDMERLDQFMEQR